MENWQRLIVIIVVVVFVVGLDLILYFKTEKLISDTQNDLGNLERLIHEEEIEKGKDDSKKLKEKWDNYGNVFSYFVEHDEVEKIGAKLAIIEENIKNKQLDTALEDIAETKYLLNYAREKYNCTLDNIF